VFCVVRGKRTREKAPKKRAARIHTPLIHLTCHCVGQISFSLPSRTIWESNFNLSGRKQQDGGLAAGATLVMAFSLKVIWTTKKAEDITEGRGHDEASPCK